MDRAGARLLAADCVALRALGNARRLGVTDGPGEEVGASRRVALAGFCHALADERFEIALSGHDRFLSVVPMPACPPARRHRPKRTTKRTRPGRDEPSFAPLSGPGRWARRIRRRIVRRRNSSAVSLGNQSDQFLESLPLRPIGRVHQPVLGPVERRRVEHLVPRVSGAPTAISALATSRCGPYVVQCSPSCAEFSL